MPDKPLILFDHDGGVDDYLSILLLMSYDHLDVRGIVVTPADCFINSAVGATRKILDLVGRSDVPVAESTVRGIYPFPRETRRDSVCIDHFPNLNEHDTIATPLVREPGQRWLAAQLRAAPRPVTLLVTGPLTTVAAALDEEPALEHKIERMLWMGGALNVNGNVRDSEHDGTAEWNVYWDPIGAQRVWQTQFPILLCPLDITNTVPLTSEFIKQLGRQRRHPVSDLAGHCYALVSHQPYYFWDVLTTAYLGVPELFTTRDWETEILVDAPRQGRTALKPGGRVVTAMHSVDVPRFYEHMLAQWRR
ncbi:MAG: nucleoside hydrolase [Anaerolineales bacterium]|nr:nucleoside hydrolase [Anaerolineales bacterium]